MKLSEIRKMVRETILAEAKKSQKKKDVDKKLKREPHPKEYSFDPALDFSEPLGDSNLYKKQGGANFGPYTGDGSLQVSVNESGEPRDIWEGLERWSESLRVLKNRK